MLVGEAGASLNPRLWMAHPSDPGARVLTPALRPRSAEGLRGLWAGKAATHTAHHAFGSLGRLPHVQLNLWRVGVKGSGAAVRLPLLPGVERAARVLAAAAFATARGSL